MNKLKKLLLASILVTSCCALSSGQTQALSDQAPTLPQVQVDR